MASPNATIGTRARRREHLVLLTLFTLIILGPVRQITGALIQRDPRQVAVRESFDETLGEAIRTYQFRSAVQTQQTRRKQQLSDREKELQAVQQETVAVSGQITGLQKVVAYLSGDEDGGSALSDSALAERAEQFSTAVRAAHPPTGAEPMRDTSLGMLLRVLEGENVLSAANRPVENVLRSRRERESYQALLIARVSADSLEYLRDRHTQLVAETDAVREDVAQAKTAVARSAADIREIQRITKDVHDQVLRLQAEMSRIDASLKAKAERALIEKGLLPPQRKSGGEAVVASAPSVAWPVRGYISAGFRDAQYKTLFGVPHEGIDIAVAEYTPVYSAAEGVVFLVRDGGATGYTYVLIGHRGGLATLYGHLESVSVATGQEVATGQVIGRSGAPGKPGSGPMMTGPHLHFEVIQNGANIDPRGVLP